ncbi:MAG: glycosyltransferase family 2 protein [Actinomycetota bacterium]|jgi:glycosyltransferase involved in cell wall biosynthesis
MSEDLEKRRLTTLREYAIGQALSRLSSDYPDHQPRGTVALICAYEEEGNIAGVLEKMPESVNGAAYTTVVVVDGGKDRTAEISRTYPGVIVIEFPVNLGHGVALQVGYRYCIDRGVDFIVTLDADGQNDPIEIPTLLVPLVNDTADFVVASRRLGEDQTSDRFRKLGVRVFSFIMNRMTGSHLTDTSTGYRSLRVSMLADVIDRLEQEQYQTAELLITCLKRGWRVDEVPTKWYPRFSGTTKKGKNWKFGFRYSRVVFATWWRER